MDLSDLQDFVIPVDIALKIVSYLQALDLCSLGSCSSFWEEVCGIDYVWECLSRDRWPGIDLDKEFSAYEDQRLELDQSIQPRKKGWRILYKMKHEDLARKAKQIAEYIEQDSLYESVEFRNYIKATEELQAMHFSFKDAQMLLFKPKLDVVVNLAALHHCIMQLDLPTRDVIEALSSRKIEKRKVSVQWKTLRGRFCLFDSPYRLRFVNGTLESFAKSGAGMFLLLQRSVNNNWLQQIQISAAADSVADDILS